MPLCILVSRTDADLDRENLLSAHFPYQHSQPVSLNHVTATNWIAEMGSAPFTRVTNVRSRQIYVLEVHEPHDELSVAWSFGDRETSVHVEVRSHKAFGHRVSYVQHGDVLGG
jgi:hypothetical protein